MSWIPWLSDLGRNILTRSTTVSAKDLSLSTLRAGAQQRQRLDAVGDQARHLLGNHAAERDADDVRSRVLSPSRCVQPTWSTTSMMSRAIAAVVYRARGLSLRPIPRLSSTRTEYLSAWTWPKKSVWICQEMAVPARPMMSCVTRRVKMSEIERNHGGAEAR